MRCAHKIARLSLGVWGRQSAGDPLGRSPGSGAIHKQQQQEHHHHHDRQLTHTAQPPVADNGRPCLSLSAPSPVSLAHSGRSGMGGRPSQKHTQTHCLHAPSVSAAFAPLRPQNAAGPMARGALLVSERERGKAREESRPVQWVNSRMASGHFEPARRKLHRTTAEKLR